MLAEGASFNTIKQRLQTTEKTFASDEFDSQLTLTGQHDWNPVKTRLMAYELGLILTGRRHRSGCTSEQKS